jgi:hypothetical protein
MKLLKGRLAADYLSGDGMVSVGIDLAARRDHSALAVTQVRWPHPGDVQHVLVGARRLPLGVPYRQQADTFAGLLRGFQRKLTGPGRVAVDVTGVGRPVAELLSERIDGRYWGVDFVTLTPGEKVDPPGPLPTSRWPGPDAIDAAPVPRYADTLARILGREDRRPTPTPHERSVSKMMLVSRLQYVVQSRRFKAPGVREHGVLQQLADELDAFEGRLGESGTITAEARPGEHDDLVVTVGLCVLDDPRPDVPADRPVDVRSRPTLPPTPRQLAQQAQDQARDARERVAAMRYRLGGGVPVLSEADEREWWTRRWLGPRGRS